MRHTAERHQNAIREGNQSAISGTQGGCHLEDRFGRPANGHRATPHQRTALAFGEPAQRGKGIGGGCQVDREHLHLMSEAIRGQQRSSVVIRGHQTGSICICGGGIGGIQRPSEALGGHPRHLEAFRGHRRSFEAVRGNYMQL